MATPLTDDTFKPAIAAWFVTATKAATEATYGPIKDWNTAAVKDMSFAFSGKTTFNEDLSRWNTDNVTTMTAMFQNAEAFNNGETAGASAKALTWNTSKVTFMNSMFAFAKAFNQPLGSNFDTREVLTMNGMFGTANKFNQFLGNKFNTSKVTDMYFMFNGATLFNNGGQALTFNTGEVTDMNGMFQGAVAFNQSLGNNFITSKVTDMSAMFNGAALFNQSLGNKFDTRQVTTMQQMFQDTTAFKGDGVYALKLTKKPNILNMFFGSGVRGTQNDKLIWAAWQYNYKYTNTELTNANLTSQQKAINLSYIPNNYTLNQNQSSGAINAIVTTLAGPTYRYKTDKVLPAGLTITDEGLISGFPQEAGSNQSYKVTLTDTLAVDWADTLISFTVLSANTETLTGFGVATAVVNMTKTYERVATKRLADARVGLATFF